MVTKQKKKSDFTDEAAYLTPTYAGRQVTNPLPKYKFPGESVAPRVAGQLIHDIVNLDGQPAQNLATFVTTWMEPEAVKLIEQGLHYNLADQDEYPHVVKIQNYCVNMLADLFNASKNETAIGTSTIGSSEAMMLAGLAMKWRWRKRRQQENKPCDKPNLVMGHNVQVCWEKFTRYFDVEPKYIPLAPNQYVITPEQVLEHIDENTIGVCAILGTTFTGEFEPIAAINKALLKSNAETGWDIPIHVDAASGGFIAPFLYPKLKWDFRLELVRSINVSGHKYGLVYPGIGWVIWRDETMLPEELVFHVNYLGGELPTFNLNFSRPASHVIAQYFNFIRLGRDGYTRIATALKQIADQIHGALAQIPEIEVYEKGPSLPLITFKLKPGLKFDVFQLSHQLRQYGWTVPAYTMPPNAEDQAVIRIVVQEKLSFDLALDLIRDIKRCIKYLKQPETTSEIDT